MTETTDFINPAPILDDKLVGFLEDGTSFEGTLRFRGHVRIGGTFKGHLITPDLVTISEGAFVSGTIEAGVVVLSGQVHATIKATHRVEMVAPALFRGEVYSPSLKVAEGVVFEGSTRMSS